jgi:hypothetical protein
MSNQEFPPKTNDEGVDVKEKPTVKTENKERVSTPVSKEDKLKEEKKVELKKRAIMDQIGFAFKSKEEKETFEKEEALVNEYIDKGIVKSKQEKAFLFEHAKNLVRLVNSEKITMPTEEEMVNLLRDAEMDKFRGILSYKDGKIQYKKSKDVNWAGSSGSAVS